MLICLKQITTLTSEGHDTLRWIGWNIDNRNDFLVNQSSRVDSLGGNLVKCCSELSCFQLDHSVFQSQCRYSSVHNCLSSRSSKYPSSRIIPDLYLADWPPQPHFITIYMLQYCCYNQTGRLIQGNHNRASRLFLYRPALTEQHRLNDVVPKKWCCDQSNNCDKFHEVRPLRSCREP